MTRRSLSSIGLTALLAVTLASTAYAQTFTPLHIFTGLADGGQPWAGLTMDSAGNLYGTTSMGGFRGHYWCQFGCGTVFQLKRTGNGWVFTTLYQFHGGRDGATPVADVVIGPDGTLYGTTAWGGITSLNNNCSGTNGCGTVYNLRPTCQAGSCQWTESVLFRFGDNYPNGGISPHSALAFDAQGNVYGTTPTGGSSNDGVVYELTRSGESWTETVVHTFIGAPTDGEGPYSGVLFDQNGNLYGTSWGGSGTGLVYELSKTGAGWTESILHNFQNHDDGQGPQGGLIFDRAGNLYGTTIESGQFDGGTTYELSPSAGGDWTFTWLGAFSCGQSYGGRCQYGQQGPWDSLAMDASGNLYGTTFSDGLYSDGSVFKLSHNPEGSWTLKDLHDFNGNFLRPPTEIGDWPTGNVVLDASGNIYGTTLVGGNDNSGVVFEITP